MEFKSDEHKYEKIINLPHHQSNKRKYMSMTERAAQFGAFRALTGYEDEIAETARYTDEKVELDEYTKADLKNYSVSSSDRIQEVEAITVTHEANGNQIIEAENEVRVQTGKNTPFGTISNNTDLPSEMVGISINISGDKKNPTTTQTTNPSSNQGENLNYPVTDNAIKQRKEWEKKYYSDGFVPKYKSM